MCLVLGPPAHGERCLPHLEGHSERVCSSSSYGMLVQLRKRQSLEGMALPRWRRWRGAWLPLALISSSSASQGAWVACSGWVRGKCASRLGMCFCSKKEATCNLARQDPKLAEALDHALLDFAQSLVDKLAAANDKPSSSSDSIGLAKEPPKQLQNRKHVIATSWPIWSKRSFLRGLDRSSTSW